jgi:predicted nucleic acid-binding protein
VTIRDVFVDTGAWFAIQAQDDAHHREARQTLPVVLRVSRALVTSNLVVGETYTLLRLTKGYKTAKRFLDTLVQSQKLERVFLTEDIEHRAYEVLSRYADHDFSYVDATSFALMGQRRIKHAFAFDVHFRTAGFVRIPVDIHLRALG